MSTLNLNLDRILQKIDNQALSESLHTMLKSASFLNVTGAATVTYLLWKTFQFVNLYFLKISALPRYRAVESSQGEAPWALITGSSDGIGKALATELASKGFNIVVHGRTPSKIAKLASDLEAQYQIKTRTLALDATDSNLSLDKPVLQALGDVKITVLINCVGGITVAARRVCELFVDRTEEEIDRIFSINGRFMTQLTRIVLPRMTEPGIIINVGSSSYHGLPYVQLYSAAKGYLNSFSIALNAEMHATGRDIDVMSVVPGSVREAGFKYAAGAFLPDTKMVAKASPPMYKKMVASIMGEMKAAEDKDLAKSK